MSLGFISIRLPDDLVVDSNKIAKIAKSAQELSYLACETVGCPELKLEISIEAAKVTGDPMQLITFLPDQDILSGKKIAFEATDLRGSDHTIHTTVISSQTDNGYATIEIEPTRAGQAYLRRLRRKLPECQCNNSSEIWQLDAEVEEEVIQWTDIWEAKIIEISKT